MPSHQSEVSTASSRERLLESAKRLFAAHGYEQTATSAIAREAGTSESQLMRYFGGKAGLLEALFEEAWIDLNARVGRAIAAAGGYRDAIVDAIQSIASALARDPDMATLFLFEARRLRGEEPRIRLSRGFLAFADTMRALVREAQAARELNRQLDPAAMTSAILGTSEALIRDRLLARLGGGRSFPEREVRRTLEAVLAGFESAPGARRSGRVQATRGRSAKSR